MAEITQKLGFDAAQAVSSLNSLNSALKGVNNQLTLFNRGTGPHPDTTRHFQQTAKQAQAAEVALRKTATQFQQTGKSGAQAGNTITLSWQTMLRVVQARILLQALNQVISLFRESATAAAEFQIQVARISTIARGPGSSISELSENVNKLSIELGRPVTEVMEAAFQALQNDLGTTADTMGLLGGAAHALALITGGDLVQAVNSISSVLKAYNLDISEAADISDVFFVAIDTGRITLDELQSSLGTLAPLGSQVGISFQELAASTAAITQSGTGGATAMTQLRNVVQKLIKPTEALEDAFAKLGVSSGKELIAATGGLIPALNALRNSVNGDEQALAKMFGTIRGQLGVFNLLANDSQIVNNILGEMEDRGGRAAKALKTIEETDGRELARQMEALNKAVRDLGTTTLKVQISLVKFATSTVGGFEALSSVISATTSRMDALLNPDGGESSGLIKVLGTLSTAVVTLGLGFTSALERAFGFNIGATKGLQTLLKATTDTIVKAREEANKRAGEIAKEAEKNITEGLKAEVATRKAVMGSYLAEVSKIYQQEVSAFQQRSQQLTAIQEGVIDGFESAAKSVSSTIDDFFANAQSRLTDRIDETKSAFQELADFKFDRDLSTKGGRSQAFALDAEAARRTTAALNALRDADASGSEIARKNALSQIKAAAAFNQRSEAAAKAVGLDQKHQNALDNEQHLLEAVAKSAKHREEVERHAQQTITKFDGETTKARIANIDALLKKQAELVAEQNKPSTTSERRADINKELQDVSKQFSDEFTKLTQDRLLQTLNLDRVFAKAALEAASALNTVESQWTGARESLQAALSRGPFKATADVVQNVVNSPTGNTTVDSAVRDTADTFTGVQNPAEQARKLTQALELVKEQARQGVNTFQEQGTKINQNSNAVDLLVDRLTNVDGAAKGTVTSIAALNEQIAGATGDQLATLTAELERIKANAQSQIDAGKLASEQAKSVQAAITALYDSIEARRAQLAAEGLFGNGVIEAADTALQEIATKFGALDLGITPERAAELFQPLTQGASSASQVMTTALTAVTTAISTQFPAASNTAKTAIAGIQPIISSISTAGAVAQMNALAAAAQRALALARAAAAAGGGSQHHGGQIFRAQGGTVPRGVDTRIVAMQPGEFVVNKKSTGKFFSQLQAINGNQLPQFREQGGPVTNIGDINVSVNSQPGESVSGRDIATSLRRELRRKSTNPF